MSRTAFILLVALSAAGCRSPLPNPPMILSDDVAFEPEWAPFRPYLKSVIATVQTRWERILVEARVYPKSGTKIAVRFRLGSDGFIASIEEVQGDAGSHAEKACVAAISTQKGYGVWSEEMVAALGKSDEMTFTFHYQ